LRSAFDSAGRQKRRLERAHRVALLEDPSGAQVTRDPVSITSSVPYIRLEPGPEGEFRPRRKKLSIEGPDGSVTFIAPWRAAPPDVDDGALVAHATDARGGEVPVSVADPRTGTIRLLVHVERIELVESDATSAWRVLVEAVFGAGMEHIVRNGGAPVVGRAVPQRVCELLGRRNPGAARLVQRRLAMLRGEYAGRAIPAEMRPEVALLEAAVKRRRVDPRVGLHETERLRRLVENRVVGSLRVEPPQIVGLLNPRRLHESGGLRALNFALRPARAARPPALTVWPPGYPQPPADALCLGPRASSMFAEMERASDVYGLVDFVVNFVETNGLGQTGPFNPMRPFNLDLALFHEAPTGLQEL
jgi:hypothetical protein